MVVGNYQYLHVSLHYLSSFKKQWTLNEKKCIAVERVMCILSMKQTEVDLY